MKLSTLLLVSALVGCGATLSDPWTHAGSGSCYDVQVNLPATTQPACPHRDHFPPARAGQTPDGRIVAYTCVCGR